MKVIKSIAKQLPSGVILFLTLALVGTGHAMAPGITEVDQTFTELSAGTADRPIMSATTVGGVFLVATIEEYCGTMSLRLVGDPDRVEAVNGDLIPAAGYELVRNEAPELFNDQSNLCNIENPYFTNSQIELTANWAAGATQLTNGNTRIAIGFVRGEGGCQVFAVDGTCQTPNPGASDLNSDGDYFDEVLQYMVLELNAATKNVSITKPLTNTGLDADGISLASDGTWIASFFPVGQPPSGPYRELRLFNVVDGTHRNTGLVKDIPKSCPGRLSIVSDFTINTLTQAVRIANGIVAFESDEVPPQPAVDLGSGPSGGFCAAIDGRAYNSDGDFLDRFIRWFDVNDPTQTVHLGPIVADRTPGGFVPDIPLGVGLLGTDGASIAYVVQESPVDPLPPCTDLTGDCDGGDNVLQIYDIATSTITNTGAAVSEGLLMPHARDALVANGIVAFLTLESSQGIPPNPPLSFGGFRDFNGDGDTNDTMLRLFDIANKRVINTSVTMINRDALGTPTSGAYGIGTDGVMAGFVRDITVPIPAPPFTLTAPGSLHYIKFGGEAGPVCSVDPSVIDNALTNGANQLGELQNNDGGWFFGAEDANCGLGAGVSCPNTFGVTALGLLAAYSHTGDPPILDKAKATGDALVARFTAQNPKDRPYAQDVEFLVALSKATGDPKYSNTAQSWFAVLVSQFPDPATRVDALLADRDSQKIRTLAAWDVASLIRAAKAVGNLAYATGAANRIIQREVDIVENEQVLKGWKDTDPAHRWDQCPNPDGCGQPGNLFSFDFTLLGEGSLLLSLHDLPGFDAKRDEYRSFLLSQQGADGTWDVADSQITAYVVLGLGSVGGAEVDAAINNSACFFTANQLTNGGWPKFVDPGGNGPENTEVNSEVLQALAVFFSTPVSPTPVTVAPSDLATVTFKGGVSQAGTTTVNAIDPSLAGTLPGGFTVFENLAFQVSTTAEVTGPITVCFSVPSVSDPAVFAALRILHNEGGVLVDRTIVPPDSPAPDFATRAICARVDSLSPFVIALLTDTTAPTITIASPANGGTYVLNAAVASSYTCSDDGSGVATCNGPVASGANFNTSAVGSKTFKVNASDVAGNTASATNTYNVMYNFSGFLPPLSSSFKLGRTIPIKWQLTDANGAFIGSAVASTTLKVDSVMCTGAADGTDPFVPASSGSTTLRYDSTSNQYIFNWQTKGLAAGCYNILMNPGDGVTRTTRIELRP